MELVDSLNRRRRDAPPQPIGNVQLTPRDRAVFKLLTRYRYLNSDVLYAFVGGNRTSFAKRLCQLYNAGYLRRPSWQWKALNPEGNPIIYELGSMGYTLLKAPEPRRSTEHWHEFMTCDIVASIEAFCLKSPDLRFIPWTEIYEYENFPSKTSAMELSASYFFDFKKGREHGHRAVAPDAVFGIEYAEKEYKFFALEADRGTEPAHRTNLKQTSWLRKFLQYQDVFKNRTYLKEWGIPKLLVLSVTSDADQFTRIQNELKLVQTQASYHLFKFLPDLGTYERPRYRLPNGKNTQAQTIELLLKEWVRVGHEPLHIWQP